MNMNDKDITVRMGPETADTQSPVNESVMTTELKEDSFLRINCIQRHAQTTVGA